MAQFIGPGTYEPDKRVYASIPQPKESHSKSTSKLVKVGKNLTAATKIPIEYHDQQKKLENERMRGRVSPGPGSYEEIPDWQAKYKNKSFNLKYM